MEACDVLIAGGGPAGSTAAALLAGRGLDVVVAERETHPRFHIGESLLPRNMEIIDRLGLRAQVEAMGVLKPGAEFVSDEDGRSVAFPFDLSLEGRNGYAYQVPRDRFDALLFGHAQASGARAMEATRVVSMQAEPGEARLRVRTEGEGGARDWAPRFFLDATGRDTFLGGTLGLKEASRLNNTAAVFAHYRGVASRQGALAGYITVHLSQDGWFWMIPLPDGVMSVGFVGTQRAFRERRGTPEQMLEERIARSPEVRARMRQAERIGPVRGAGNYSYRARRAWGDRWMMIGDAFGFIDPVFSSGVLLAMSAAERGADVACAWLEDPRHGAALARRAERQARAAMDEIAWLIYRINTPVLRGMFLSPGNRFRMRDGLITLLTGNLHPRPATMAAILAFKATYYALSALHRAGAWDPAAPAHAAA
jgi:flavin-dependent dehydrogenase